MAEKPEPTARSSRIRAGLPGDSWRPYVRSGAERAYDGPLAPARAEAKQLRRRGRLVAAHRREKGAYLIRARGYDRKRLGVEPFEKAYTKDVMRIGPYTRSRTRMTLRKPDRAERRRENLVATGRALGGLRAAAALTIGTSAGAGIASRHERGESVKTDVDHQEGRMAKAFDIDDILASNISKSFGVDLIDIEKGFWNATWDAFKGSQGGKLVGALKNRASQGWESGGFTGARDSVRNLWNQAGGSTGTASATVRRSAQDAVNTGLKEVDPKKAALYGGGAAALGLGAYGAKRLAGVGMQRAKSKALKYAGYGAAGIGGTAALGSYLGSRAGG